MLLDFLLHIINLNDGKNQNMSSSLSVILLIQCQNYIEIDGYMIDSLISIPAKRLPPLRINSLYCWVVKTIDS